LKELFPGSPGKLEDFFTKWANREPRKPLSLIIIKLFRSPHLEVKKENIIEKFKMLGVIKTFKIVN